MPAAAQTTANSCSSTGRGRHWLVLLCHAPLSPKRQLHLHGRCLRAASRWRFMNATSWHPRASKT